MKNSPDLDNDIDNNEENDLHLDFKRVAKNSPLNTKYTFKGRPPVVVIAHPENQTRFSKVQLFPTDKPYNDTATKSSRKVY